MPSNPENAAAAEGGAARFIARAKQYLPDPQVTRLVVTGLRALIAAALVVIVAIKINDIGWEETLRSLPRAPMFYLYFAIAYWILPLAELVIYRALWPIR